MTPKSTPGQVGGYGEKAPSQLGLSKGRGDTGRRDTERIGISNGKEEGRRRP
jgi:hypothetical protein